MTNDHELDAALHRVMATTAQSPAEVKAAERIVQRLGSVALPSQDRVAAWWPLALMDRDFAPAWPRLAALACAAGLGITIGFSSLGMRIAADLDLVRVASAEDAGGNIFDIDTVTGIRP